MAKNLTSGNVFSILIKFSLPYLLSCFLQTFYGLADLFITGQFYGATAISAVSIGSQLMHMFTVILAGLAMGATVSIGRCVGERNQSALSRVVGNSIIIFALIAAVSTVLLIFLASPLLRLIFTPEEAFGETLVYVLICFAGIPFITAYNVLSSIFRGLGDTKSPMIFVLVAGVFNIILDYLFIGLARWGTAGAASATVVSQAASVIFALISLRRIKNHGNADKNSSLRLAKEHFRLDSAVCARILKIGVPIALQDGLIQVSFMVITAIANSRGLAVAAAVGIVEKIICFLFLVPSAMLSSVSAIAAQNAGAALHERGKQTLGYAIAICVIFGAAVFGVCQFASERILRLFSSSEAEVIRLGAGYLRAYTLDCVFAGVHFCFSGYFCAYGKSLYSFAHNIISIAVFRIPGAVIASAKFPDTLYPLGLAAPIGSFFSVLICLAFFHHLSKQIGSLFQPQS